MEQTVDKIVKINIFNNTVSFEGLKKYIIDADLSRQH